MSDPLLTFLKYIFLAFLYLFFLRVLRAVWTELREPKVVTTGGPAAAPAGPVGDSRRAKRAKTERMVVVEPPEGKSDAEPLPPPGSAQHDRDRVLVPN